LLSVIGFVVVALLLVCIGIYVDTGLRSKFCVLFGLDSGLSKERWRFIPCKHGERSDNVIVSFAGGALKIAGHTQHEFINILSNVKADSLFLLDEQQSFYLKSPSGNWNNFPLLEQQLTEFLAPYNRKLFIGASMGGSAALMFAHLSTACLSFAPFIDLDKDVRLFIRLTRFWFPKSARSFLSNQILSNMRNCADKIKIHIGVFPPDVVQANVLETEDRKRCLIVHADCSTHAVAKHLRDKSQLLQTIKSMI